MVHSVSGAEERFLENGGPSGPGSELGFLLDTPTRVRIDLSGDWDYEVEGGSWGSVRIPAAYDFTGKVTFSRKFSITQDQASQFSFSLVMFGVNYRCEIFINGDFIAAHIGGYTSFVQSIPENTLQPGSENTITVAVDNELDPHGTIPLRSQVGGWRNYGGILRDVFIVGMPMFHIAEVSVRSHQIKGGTKAKVSIEGTFEGEYVPVLEDPKKRSSIGFYAELFDKVTGLPVVRTPVASITKSEIVFDEFSTPTVSPSLGWNKARGEVTLEEAKLWSPDYPDLYLVKCYLVRSEGKEMQVLDEYDVVHGIRAVEIVGGSIFLNGGRFALKGVVWNEDHPIWGSSLPYEQKERDIDLVKSLGANVVRFADHPPHPYMLNLCDRYGLMAMEELPVVNVPAVILSQESYLEVASTMMKEMIIRDRAHPSLLAWGLGDGFESSSSAARPFVGTLARLAKSLDDRPTYYTSRMDEDVCKDLVDMTAVHVYTRDMKVFKGLLEDWKAADRGRSVILPTFGTEVQQGNRNGYSDPLSYEAQARFFLQRFDVLKSLGYPGGIVWSLNDWKGDRPALAVSSGDPWIRSFGLVSSQREKRLAYDAVRAAFRGEKFVAMPSGNYSASAPIIYVLSGLVLLIGGAYLYNSDRRFRENVNRSVMNSYNFFADIRDQRIVSVLHSTLLGAIASVALAIVVSTMLYHFRDSLVLDTLLSYLLTGDELKEQMVFLILHPLQFILYFSFFFFCFLLLMGALLLVLSPLFRSRLYPYHAYALVMWALPPLLILVPVGMILFRVMESEMYVGPAFILLAILVGWVLLRLLKGISIVTDVYPAKVYAVGLCSLAGIGVMGYFYLDYAHSASAYVSFLYRVVSSYR